MREDIAKKLCERPRFGGNGKTQFKKHERRAGKDPNKWDTLPKKESMKRPNIRHWSGKYLNEYFPPLHGFLKKNVGRPWDKVFSEICEHLNPRTAVQKHVFDHLLRDFVVEKPLFVEGSKIPYRPEYGSKHGLNEVRGFYVDQHGLLKDNDGDKARKRRARERKRSRRTVQRKRINDREEYRRIGGHWFHVWYDHLRQGQRGFDVILRKEFQVGRWGCYELQQANGHARHAGEKIFDAYRVCVKKLQVSKKEIHREGLNKL